MNEAQFNNFLKKYASSILCMEHKFLGEIKNSRIYHYTSPQGLLGIMRDDSCANLRFSKYNSLNDRDEKLDIIKHIKLYSNTIPKKETTNEFIEFVANIQPHDKTFVTSKENSSSIKFSAELCDIYLCCFSQEDDLLPMWNYYSKSKHYEGYCIGFLSKHFKSESCFGKGYSIELHKVIYLDEEKKNILSCLFNPLEDLYYKLTQRQKEVLKGILQTYIDKFQFLFKNSCFSHEHEIRAILQIPRGFDFNNSMLKKDFCESHGYIIPYIEFRDLKRAIKSVRIAPLYEKELAIANLQEFFNEKDYKDITIGTSSVPIRF